MALRTSGDPGLCNDRDAEAYRKDKTCILVRRRISFVPHKGLLFPAYFDDRCLGVPCEEDQSCFRGRCVDADVTCDADSVCRIPAERAAQSAYRDPSRPIGGVVNDSGVLVFPDGATTSTDGATVSSDGAAVGSDGAAIELDGASSDGSSSSDGSLADGSSDSSSNGDTGPFDTGTGPVPDGGPDASTDGASGGANFDCSRCTAPNPACCGSMGNTVFNCRPVCNPGEMDCKGAAKTCNGVAVQ